jgi:hypothetical protein
MAIQGLANSPVLFLEEEPDDLVEIQLRSWDFPILARLEGLTHQSQEEWIRELWLQ